MNKRNPFETLFNWELWNFKVLYAPLSLIWLWYCLKSRSLWFFSPSNPTICFGGFEGEGKKEMYQQLPQEVIPKTIYINPRISFAALIDKIAAAGLQFPFVVKPDVGMKGILFRIIENEVQLKLYHERIPVRYLVQSKVNFPVEVSVFYYRYPWEAKGQVSGFIHKELLHVIGDGKSTLESLINEHPRAKHRAEEMQHKHGHRYNRIIAEGDVFYLSFAGNHNRGAKFTNLHAEINDSLANVFDQLSQKTQFYYGRYDIMTQSIEDLKQGKNFTILEYNGAGAEPNHIYDCGMSLWNAYKTILRHWSALYKISRHNAQNGFPYWSFKRGRKYLLAARKHFDLLGKFE